MTANVQLAIKREVQNAIDSVSLTRDSVITRNIILPASDLTVDPPGTIDLIRRESSTHARGVYRNNGERGSDNMSGNIHFEISPVFFVNVKEK